MWEVELANKMKQQNQKARDGAISNATGSVGTVESVNPLQIRLSEYELYEEDEIIVAEHVTLSRDDTVICMPVDNRDTIAVIGKVRH